MGLIQIKRLNDFLSRRHEIAERYDAELKSLPIITPYQAPGTYSSYHLYPIRVNETESGKTQRQIYDALWKKGIAANVHYIPAHRHPYYENLGFKESNFPEAERFYREMITLPIYPNLMENQRDIIISLNLIWSD